MYRHFLSRLTPTALIGAALALVGIVVMMTGLVRTVRTASITPISDCAEYGIRVVETDQTM